MDSREELKPCPFCGGKAEIVDIDEGENTGGSCVCCTQCQASSNVEFEFKENFVSNWNCRATPSPEAAGSAEAPVAWEYELACGQLFSGKYCGWKWKVSGEYPNVPPGSVRNLRPLFARAQDFRAGIEAAAARARAARFQSYGPQDHPERIAEAIEALAPPAGAGEWQPMDTAPKDGTEIIGYRPDQGVFVFRWAWMEEFVPKDQHGDPTEPYDEDFACWWHDRWDWMEGELTPTLWQPLPAAPGDGG